MGIFGHLAHFAITVLFFPWIIVWIICALCMGASRKREEREMRQEELELLKLLVKKGNKE